MNMNINMKKNKHERVHVHVLVHVYEHELVNVHEHDSLHTVLTAKSVSREYFIRNCRGFLPEIYLQKQVVFSPQLIFISCFFTHANSPGF
jgi:hypothetical protein